MEKKGGMPVMETRQFEVPPRTIVVFVGKEILVALSVWTGPQVYCSLRKLFLWMLI